MADARKTWAQLDVLFATNSAGAISAQDLRDGFQSLQPHVASDAPGANDDETVGFDIGHEWLDSSEPAIYKCRDASTGAAAWEKVWPQTGGGGGSVESFTDLSDAPSDYTGAGGKAVFVTMEEDGLEFVDPPNAPDLTGLLPKLATINDYAANRTLDASDGGAYVRVTAAGTVTLPDGLATGFQCVIVNATDSDTVTLAAATTLTIPPGFEPAVQNRRAITVIHVGSNAWEAHGALVEEEA